MTHSVSSTNDRNSKNKTTDSPELAQWSIALQGSYTGLSLSLFNNGTLVDTVHHHDSKASSHLIPLLDDLLTRHQCSLPDLAYLAVDKGPGAFTSLRVVIATVNGIHYATQKPLIGIDGLEGLYHEVCEQLKSQPSGPESVAVLLNAYNNDCYTLIGKTNDAQNIIFKGCEQIEQVLYRIQENIPERSIAFVGNGALLHEQLIKQTCGERAIFDQTLPLIVSSEYLGYEAEKRFKRGLTDGIITPNYMKTQLFTTTKK